jgi:drug/metabolite transporter (DMT)-like permease
MYYIYVIVASLMWSFVGIMVKTASGMVDSSMITLCRFLFGAAFLACFLLLKKKRLRVFWRDKWIWIGVVGKSGNYIFENIAITMGFVYGNIVVWPVQAIFLAAISVIFFKEKMYLRKVMAVIFCIAGVILISWRGVPLKEFSGTNLIPLGLFALAAIGAGIYIISQKKLVDSMNSLNMNFSAFLLSSILTAVPVPFTFKVPIEFNVLAICSLVGLGIVTGASFYLYAEALKRIPFLVAVMISNSSVIFTLLWAWLFYHEVINGYMLAGTVIMLTGLVLINIPYRKQKTTEKEE